MVEPARATTRWTAQRINHLAELWNAGLPAPAIARRLGTSRVAIESKLAKLRRAGRDLVRRRCRPERRSRRASRRCLYCGSSFASEHVGNRICPTCLEEGPFTSAML
jgi:hypothetical protein